MVVDVGLEVDLAQQAVEREVLGLRQRVRTAIGLAAGLVGGALLIDRALGRIVPVRVDAVALAALGRLAVDPVAVVVAQRLAPEPVAGGLVRPAQMVGRADAAGERVVVAVGVLDRHEPELGPGQQVGDPRVVLVLDHPPHEPALDLCRDPLAGVVVGRVQDRRPRAVRHVAGVAGDLQDGHGLAERRRADALVLDDVAVVGRELHHLVVDAAGLHELAVDVVVRIRTVTPGFAQRLRRERRELDGLERDAAALEPVGVGLGEHDRQGLFVALARVVAGVLEIDSRGRELGGPTAVDDGLERPQVVLRGRRRSRTDQQCQSDSEQCCRRASVHAKPLPGSNLSPRP